MGLAKDHEFNARWLREARRVLKADGTLWVTGTHHIIFSIGFALQRLGYRIINQIAWQKPDPPPNALHTAFTHLKTVGAIRIASASPEQTEGRPSLCSTRVLQNLSKSSE
jgi:DNA modification methylase